MQVDDIRFLFGFDRWATARVLAATEGVDEATWSAENAIDTRGLGGILVHHLGASQRWRNGLLETGLTPRPEREPLPTLEALRTSWDEEWAARETWLAAMGPTWLEQTDEGVAFWQMLAHVVNHGTQHRSEAATLLTAVGQSPGDLDMIFYAEETAAGTTALAAARTVTGPR
jgi:uncharacterized damage-inducible protein DinB